jgi:hypothetical protein
MVERHVPVLPFSRDAKAIVDLRRTLAIYRLVFGQPRQDDLVAYLQEHVSPDEFDVVRSAALIDLRPQPPSS